jgi:hypothetical protein
VRFAQTVEGVTSMHTFVQGGLSRGVCPPYRQPGVCGLRRAAASALCWSGGPEDAGEDCGGKLRAAGALWVGDLFGLLHIPFLASLISRARKAAVR